MYNSRAYDWTRNAAVRENGTMGRHASDSPPPMIVGDSGKRRPIRDRLQNITSAMSWIKEELVSRRDGRGGGGGGGNHIPAFARGNWAELARV